MILQVEDDLDLHLETCQIFDPMVISRAQQLKMKQTKNISFFDITSQNIVPCYRPGGDENGLKVS